jgi:hypothetical protein
MSAFGLASGINGLLGEVGTGALTNPAGWFVAGAVVSGSILFGAVGQMFQNGVTPAMAAIGAAALVGTAIFTNLALMWIFGISSTFGPIGWAVAAVVVAISILWAWLHQPPPEQVAAQNLQQAMNPVIWTPGPLVVVAVGTVAVLMGWAKTQTPPAMASLTVPAYYVNQVLAASGVPSIDLKSKTPAVIVEPGDGRVVIVSPDGTDSRGNPLVNMQTFSIAKNLQFISSPNIPPDGAYIPFFLMVNGKLSTKVNPVLMHALTIQDKMLQAALSGTLLTHDALNAVNVAAASNKSGISAGN